MPKSEDLTGQKFGRLTVLNKDFEASKQHGRAYWLCQCECGKQKIIAGLSLKNGATQSCGCLRNEKVFQATAIDETGKRYGKLLVLKMDVERSSRGLIKWICQCDCGNIVSIPGVYLRNGNTQSCGCSNGISKGEQKIIDILEENNYSYIREYRPKELNGKRFDFALLNEENIIIRFIEFDGEQHFKQSKWGKDKLERTKKSDLIKNKYCLNKKIPLVRIPYWELNQLSLELLLSNKYLVQEE